MALVLQCTVISRKERVTHFTCSDPQKHQVFCIPKSLRTGSHIATQKYTVCSGCCYSSKCAVSQGLTTLEKCHSIISISAGEEQQATELMVSVPCCASNKTSRWRILNEMNDLHYRIYCSVKLWFLKNSICSKAAAPCHGRKTTNSQQKFQNKTSGLKCP